MTKSTKTKVVRTGNSLKQLGERFSNLTRLSVEVGHFLEQGNHSEADHLTLVDLMRMHSTGYETGGVSVPPRPILAIFLASIKNKLPPPANAAIDSFLKTTVSQGDVLELLNTVGAALRAKEKSIFGHSPPLTSNSKNVIKHKGNRNTPMVDSGELKERTAYKTSIDKKVRE